MDVEKFDRRYPTPAHAAPDYGRHRPHQPRARMFGISAIIADRAGMVGLATGVILAVGGAIALYLSSGTAPKPDGARVILTKASKGSARTTQTLPAPALPDATPRRERVIADQPGIGTSSDPVPPAIRAGPVRRKAGASIAEPLEGEALRAALIIDKQRTLELNVAQLASMAERRDGPTGGVAKREP